MISKGLNLSLMILAACLTSCAEKAPSFAVLDGEPANITTDKRMQILNYWAVWCIPCIEEMPELAEFNELYKDQVAVYGVNYDRPSEEELRQAVEELNVGIPVLLEDPNEILGFQRPEVLPTTIVLVSGEIKEVVVGPQTKNSLEALLNRWK